MYCPCCKQYEETDYDPIENLNKFMKFIKEEHEKMFPQKKKKESDNRHRKDRPLPDDSVSEITDLDDEEILAKYYKTKLSKIEKRRRDRAETQRRLRGEKVELKHQCKTIHTKKHLFTMGNDPNEEVIEMELR